MAQSVKKMLVLDFSGTLSLEATLYAQTEKLWQELHETGLVESGVDSVDTFWNKIVNPTWPEGSTTTKGYKQLLFEQLCRLSTLSGAAAQEDTTWTGVSQFVDRYFAWSVIDPAWQRFIETFLDQPGVLVVVAADHYAEATGHIRSQLAALGLQSIPALEAAGGEGQVVVANSADIGHPKASEFFWAAFKQSQDIPFLTDVVMIDDFGFNEQPLDSYASEKRVVQRLDQTVRLLSSVFEAHVLAFPFFLWKKTANQEILRQEYYALIKQAQDFAVRALLPGLPGSPGV